MPVWHVARAPEGAVFIGRPSRWGNRSEAATREERIEEYRRDLWRRIRSGELELTDLAQLDGEHLACYCAPRPCHGDVLLAAAAWAHRALLSLGGPPPDRSPS